MPDRAVPFRILGFDSWTRGSHHFARLVEACTRRNASLRLVHLGSWGNDADRPLQERIGPLDVCDISLYGHSLQRALDAERPDAAVVLSSQTFAHRAFLRYCRQRSIPTLLLYHGLASMQVTDDKKGSFSIDTWAYARFIASKLGKMVHRTLPAYAGSLWKTGAGGGDWLRFGGDIVRMARGSGSWQLATAKDARTDHCAVYTNADIEHARRVFGFEPHEVVAVGNPDLVRFGFSTDMLGSRLRAGASSPSQAIMYIDTGLVATGLVFDSQAKFVQHILGTARSLAAQGKTLLFKPHPAHDPEFLRSSFAAAGVEVVANENFIERLRDCAACIVEPSTLAVIPALMGVPMFYAAYADLSGLRYGPVLTSYPLGQLLRNIDDLSKLLADCPAMQNPEATQAWIARNSGPLPAEEMPDRVVDILVPRLR